MLFIGNTILWLCHLKTRLYAAISVLHHYQFAQKTFRTTPMPLLPPLVKGHSHEEAAARRSQAVSFIDSFCRNTGMTQYQIGLANRDVDRLGVRGYYWAKDMQVSPRCDQLPTHGNTAMVFVDVDYHVNMYHYMAYRLPILLYTFAPLTPAGHIPNGTYTSARNSIQVNIEGNASYEHKLYDYCVDHLVHRGWFTDSLYLVEHKTIEGDANHRVIGMFPVRTAWNWFGLWNLPGPTLQYRRFSFGEYNRMDFVSTCKGITNKFVSVSRADRAATATMPDALLTAVCMRIVNSKDIVTSSIEGTLRTYIGGKTLNFDKLGLQDWVTSFDPFITASVLCDVLSARPSLIDERVRPQSNHKSYDDLHYTIMIPNQVPHEEKQTMRSLIPTDQAVVTGVVAPTAGLASDTMCIQERVMKQKNICQPPKKFDRYGDEFRAFCVPEKLVSSGAPVTLAEVEERQSKPSQRRIIARAAFSLWNVAKKTISSFQKRESYAKVTAPRNISTIEGTIKVRFSRFTYAFAEVMHTLQFYAFCLTPRQIEQRMSAVAAQAKHIVPTDFSKFDGTHSAWLAKQEQLLYLRYFAPEYHQELKECQESLFNCRGYTRYGVVYDSGDGRASGSPDTSIGNTIDNALTAYIAFRESGLLPAQAWNALGLYGGDDGVTPDVALGIYTRVATQLGLKLKATIVAVDEPIPFLGRVFFGVWGTALWSMSDLPRQLSKLHVTASPNTVPDWLVLYRKALGFLLTDTTTPLLSHWSRAVVRCVTERKLVTEGLEHTHDQRFFERYSNEHQFAPVEREAAMAVATAQLGVDEFSIATLCYYWDNLPATANISELFRTLVRQDLVVEFRAVMGDRIVEPPTVDPVGTEPAMARVELATPTGSTANAKPLEPNDSGVGKVVEGDGLAKSQPPSNGHDKNMASKHTSAAVSGSTGKRAVHGNNRAAERRTKRGASKTLRTASTPSGSSVSVAFSDTSSSNPEGPNVSVASGTGSL